MSHRCVIVAAATATITFVACGSDRPAAKVIVFEMGERSFSPATLSIKQGSFVILRFHNGGSVHHEAIVGDESFHVAHEEHTHLGGDSLVNGVVVEPGNSGDVPYRFDQAGTIIVGCHEPGHWESGMKVLITIVGARP